jgi:hypothetical protein
MPVAGDNSDAESFSSTLEYQADLERRRNTHDASVAAKLRKMRRLLQNCPS